MPILSTHKEGLVYIEHVKIFVKNGIVNFGKKEDAFEKHYSLPIKNVCGLLLGSGTSLSQQAARALSSEGVLVAFVGGGGVPIFFASQSEYRSPAYLQAWIRMWQSEKERIKTTKYFNKIRADLVDKQWNTLFSGAINPEKENQKFLRSIEKSNNIFELLGHEANYTKALYTLLSKHLSNSEFKRVKKMNHQEKLLNTNSLLSKGNYLAYGLAACTLWVLGIPHSLPVTHGRTRRGALVFDIADLVKDSCVMPQAFLSHSLAHTTGKFKSEVLENFERTNALHCMFESIKNICSLYPENAYDNHNNK